MDENFYLVSIVALYVSRRLEDSNFATKWLDSLLAIRVTGLWAGRESDGGTSKETGVHWLDIASRWSVVGVNGNDVGKNTKPFQRPAQQEEETNMSERKALLWLQENLGPNLDYSRAREIIRNALLPVPTEASQPAPSGASPQEAHHHHCACGDEFPTVTEYLEHREMVHDEDVPVASAGEPVAIAGKGNGMNWCSRHGINFKCDEQCPICATAAPASTPASFKEGDTVFIQATFVKALYGDLVQVQVVDEDSENDKRNYPVMPRGLVLPAAPASTPADRDAEDNLADYLLRNQPPTWDYATVLRLAKTVATAAPPATERGVREALTEEQLDKIRYRYGVECSTQNRITQHYVTNQWLKIIRDAGFDVVPLAAAAQPTDKEAGK